MLRLPLSGDMSTSLCVGDSVDKGMLVASAGKARLHSPVSGTVREISDENGARTLIIENDFTERVSPDVTPFTKKLGDATSDEIFDIIENLGITDLPSFALSDLDAVRAATDGAKHLYISCIECEPSISSTLRLLLEEPTAILNGTKILLKALGLRRADIILDDTLRDVVNKITALIGENKLFRIRTVHPKYPLSNARQLLYAINGVEIPITKNPVEVGSFAVSATTAAQVFDAFATGMPVTERIVTVGGDCLKKPWNVVARVGTPISEVVAFCGGVKKAPARVILGGLMNGQAVESPDAPILPSTTAVTLLSKSYSLPTAESVCIHCGRCVDVCPMRIMPSLIAKYANKGDYATCEKLDIASCIECGCCSFVCPGNMPLVETIARAKRVVAAGHVETEDAPKVEDAAVEESPVVEAPSEVDIAEEATIEDTIVQEGPEVTPEEVVTEESQSEEGEDE